MRSLTCDESFFSAFFLTYNDLSKDKARQYIAQSSAVLDHITQLIFASSETTLALDIPYMERDLRDFVLHRRPDVENLQQMERLVFAILTNADQGELTAEQVSFRMAVCDNFCLCIMSEFLHRYGERHIEHAYDLILLTQGESFAHYSNSAYSVLSGDVSRDAQWMDAFVRRMFAAMKLVALMANDVEPISVWEKPPAIVERHIDQVKAHGFFSALMRALRSGMRRLLGRG